MLTLNQWNSLLHLFPTDFRHPERMQWSVVKAMDDFIGIVKAKPIILSDYREPQPTEKESQHHHGLAIDPYWPDLDPIEIWNAARAARLFHGLGIYKNEEDAVSFHFDTREDRTVDNPALWSGDIVHPYDPATRRHYKLISYYAWSYVVEYLKKKRVVISGIVGLAALSYAIYRLLR